MKKTIISAFVLMFLASLNSVANAEVNVGFTASTAGVFLRGQENLKTTYAQSYGDEDFTVEIASVFVEYDNGSGTVFGIDWVPVDASSKHVKNSKVDVDTVDGRAASATVINDAQADFANLLTLYMETQVMDSPFFVKAGARSVSVQTNESLGTGEKYGDKDVIGGLVGIGVKKSFGRAIVKLGANYSAFENIKITGTNGNKIEVQSQILDAQLSVGMQF